MRSHAALVIVILSLLVIGTGAAHPMTGEPLQQADIGTVERADETVMTIHVQQDGDARWNVTSRFALTSENETAAFDQLATDFENGAVETRFSMDVFERIADASSDETGREMTITDVTRTTSRTNETGRLTLTFTWTNFSQASAGRIMVGDVFEHGSGTWLPSLSADQQLIITPPDGYVVTNTPQGIGVNNGTIQLSGPHSFDSDGLDITIEGNGEEPTTSILEDINWEQIPVLVLLITAMGVGGLGVYVWTKRRRSPGAGLRSERHETVTEQDSPEADGSGTEAVSEPVEEPADVEAELLSDEERVERLIEENGGRMMQANIVKETGWSNAKVSQLLSSMDDEGRITKLRIGRQNLIAFPDEDVTEFK